MKPLHWKPIKRGWEKCIWGELNLNKATIKAITKKESTDKDEKEQDSKDKDKQVLILDIDEIERLFSKKKKPKKVKSDKPRKKKKELIALLDRKRSDNMCIALSRLKMDNEVIRDAILAVDEQQLNLDLVQKLIPIVPTNEEQQMLKEFHENPSDLETAEKFVYALRYIENLSNRLEFWQFKMQFSNLCGWEQDKIDTFRDAYNTVYESKSFKLIMQYTLLVGNFMNTGNKRTGGVNGFEISALLKLGDTKANDKKTSVLEFIVTQCHYKHPNALEFADKFLDVLPPAMRLDLELIRTNIDGIGKKLKQLESMVKEKETEKKEEKENKDEDNENKDDDEGKNDEDADDEDDKEEQEEKQKDMFDPIMSQFLAESKSKFDLLQSDFHTIEEELQELAEYLGEKDDKELKYLETLNEFSESVAKETQKIKKHEEDEERAKRKAEAEEKRQQELFRKKKLKQLQDAQRKQHRQHGSSKTHRTKPSQPPPPRPHPSQQSVHDKIEKLSSRKNLLHSKQQSKQKPVKQAPKNWNCPNCTFLNHYLIPNCEMCNAPKPKPKPPTLLRKQPTMTEKVIFLFIFLFFLI